MNDCGQDLERLAPFNASEAVQLLKTLSKNLTKVCNRTFFERRSVCILPVFTAYILLYLLG